MEFFGTIFGYDFEAKYFVKFCSAVNESLVGKEEDLLSKEEYGFTMEHFRRVSELKTFQISIKGILKKAEKHLVKHYAQKLMDRGFVGNEIADLIIKRFN
jgi:hypothetical protein